MKQIKIFTTLFLISFLTIQLSAQTQGSGYALSFDGTDDYIDCGNGADLSFGDGSTDTPMTISAWVKRDDLTAQQTIISRYDSGISPKRKEYILRIEQTGAISFLTFDNSDQTIHIKIGITSVNTISDKSWHSVVGVYNGNGQSSGFDIYIDGIKTSHTVNENHPTEYTAMSNTGETLKIGRTDYNTSTIYFKGGVDEVRIWNRALSETEIRNNMNKTLTGNEDGLVAYYKMDEGADSTCPGGKDVCDKSGNGNHGTKH